MKISVVTIVYNDKSNIGKTIESVLTQSARLDIEYIVVDGLSTDGTSEIIEEKYADKIDIYIREQDSGIYNAMNKGMASATGDYIIYMNSGDSFSHSDVIKTAIINIESCSEKPVLVYGDYREVKNGIYTNPIPARNPNWIWYGPVASHQSTFYSLQFLRNHNLLYDENYKIAADYKLTLDVITRSSDNVLRIACCVSDFDISGCSNTNQNLGLQEANRARREVLKWGVIRTSGLTLILIAARYTKKYLSPLYRILRH